MIFDLVPEKNCQHCPENILFKFLSIYIIEKLNDIVHSANCILWDAFFGVVYVKRRMFTEYYIYRTCELAKTEGGQGPILNR